MNLRGQMSLLRQWAWLLVLCAVGAGALAYAVSQSQPKVYEAHATVVVGPSLTASSPDYSQLLASQLLAQTFAQIATTRPLLERVLGIEHSTISVDEIQKRVLAEAPNDSTLISIIAQGSDPKMAAQLANDVAAQLVGVSRPFQARQKAAQEFIDQQVTATQEEITSLTDEIARLVALPSGDVGNAQRLDDLDNRLASLQAAYAALLSFSTDSAPNVLTVIEPATAPETSSGPRVLVDTALAAAAGLLIAIGFVFAREQLDDTVRWVRDVEISTGAPLLGVVPELQRGSERARRLPMVDDPQSAAAEAFRSLRTNLEFARNGAPLRRLLVTSSLPGEGKTTTATNLAVAFAQAGRATVLVDADLRQPGVDQIFGVDNAQGLSTQLASNTGDLTDRLQMTAIDNLRVLTAGPRPLNPAELLLSQRMQALLHELDDIAELVILDSPAVGGPTDAAILSASVTGTLLVVQSGRTSRSMLRRARETLRLADAVLLGVTVSRATTRSFKEESDDEYFGHPIVGRDNRAPDSESQP